MNDLDVCRMGDRCRGDRIPAGNGWEPAFADGRGVCSPCEAHARHAIGQLREDWTQLTDQVGKDAGRNGIAAFGGGGKASPPLPLRLDVDAAARRIAWMLDVWAAAVFERLPVAEAGRRREFAERGVRQSWAVARSTRILTTHFPALLALGPTAYMPYGEDHTEPAEDDGPGAVVGLVDLHHRARQMLGETKRFERRDLPCPPAPDGCGLDNVLVREIGYVFVQCTNCGWWCTDAEYDEYALTFLPPRRGAW